MSTQSLAPADPARLGPYTLRWRLGSGGMGVVYLAEGPDGRPVALKCLPHGVDSAVRRRLEREAEALAAVRHPRVAHFVAADTRAARPWIAMQYIAGPSLAQVAVPLGPAQLRHLTEGLAEALAALHARGLVHRDVKPGNIILTHAGPVLVDLGIAAGSDLTSLTTVGTIVGTPEWMAPEQLRGLATGPRTDTWGWACVAVYAATGRVPFGSGAIEALAYRIRHEQPDLTGVPEWLRGAVVLGLSKDPDARPALAELAAVDGIRRVGGTPPAAVLPRPTPSPSRPVVTPGAVVRPGRPVPPTPVAPVASVAPVAGERPAATRLPPPQIRAASPPGANRQAPDKSAVATGRGTGRAAPQVPQRQKRVPAAVPQVAAPPSTRGTPARPTGRPVRRRSWARRIGRALLVLLLVLLVAVATGIGAYLLVSHQQGAQSLPAVRPVTRGT